MTTLPVLLSRIGWRASELARRLGIDERIAQRWVAGTNWRGGAVAPPADVVAWLERVAAVLEMTPPPGNNQEKNNVR